MLKRNLIPVAIISITLFLVGNASGQIPKKRITPKKSQISVMGVGGGVDDRRVGKNMGKKKRLKLLACRKNFIGTIIPPGRRMVKRSLWS